jgi:hypothetical protein
MVVVLLAATCSGPGANIAITVDLQTGGSWVASGRSVDEKLFCGEGSRRVVEYRDVDGTLLSEESGRAELAAAATDGRAADLQLLVEMTCADGSGVISLVETPAAGTWVIDHGNGAYSALSGSGTLVATHAVNTAAASGDQEPDRALVMLNLEGNVGRSGG